MASKNIPLSELFASMQNQMSAQLSTNRSNIIHSVSKGDALENAWIEWLRKYLPNRYSVDKAIVIDSNGDISDQIDVVIYDNWFTPFIFTQNGFHYIPAEGVYAIFEVKPDISGFSDNKHNIEYTGEKIESVRKLDRGSAKFINGGNSCGPRPLTKIIGGILTSTKSGFPPISLHTPPHSSQNQDRRRGLRRRSSRRADRPEHRSGLLKLAYQLPDLPLWRLGFDRQVQYDFPVSCYWNLF